MYSRKGIFGRTREAFFAPPLDATTRSIAQIGLVPTLSLLLGIPIPFNSLGAPIEEAFVGHDGTFLENLAQVSRLAALGMERFQSAYSSSTGRDLNTSTGAAQKLWEVAVKQQSSNAWAAAHDSFSSYQSESLPVYRELWTSFDMVSMGKGILVTGLSVVVLLLFAKVMLQGDVKLQPECLEFSGMSTSISLGSSAGFICSLSLRSTATESEGLIDAFVFQTALGGIIGVLIYLMKSNTGRVSLLATGTYIWPGLSILFVLSQTIGYASNSYTI
jgi:GPI ethanolamine phosphate transferase 3 subunit O